MTDADIEMAELEEQAATAAAGVCPICETPLNPLDPKWAASYARDAARPNAPTAQDDADFYGPPHPTMPDFHERCFEEER